MNRWTCANCGARNETEGDAIFCPSCGATFSAKSTASVTAASPQAVIGGVVVGTFFGFGFGVLTGLYEFGHAYGSHTVLAPVIVLTVLQNLIVVAAFVIGVMRMRAGRQNVASFYLAFGAAAMLPTAACDVMYIKS